MWRLKNGERGSLQPVHALPRCQTRGRRKTLCGWEFYTLKTKLDAIGEHSSRRGGQQGSIKVSSTIDAVTCKKCLYEVSMEKESRREKNVTEARPGQAVGVQIKAEAGRRPSAGRQRQRRQARSEEPDRQREPARGAAVVAQP